MFDSVLESATSLRNQIRHKVDDNTKKAQEKQKRDHRHLKRNDIKVGDKVLLRNNKRNDRKGGKFTFKWLGPYEVDNLTQHGLASLTLFGLGGPQRPPYYIFVYISLISNQNKMKFGDFS